jgi:Dolichyl-phosphate-mannose-protein mannosyltransferase
MPGSQLPHYIVGKIDSSEPVKESVLSTESVYVEEYRSDLLPHPPAPLSKDLEFWLILASLTAVYVTALYFTAQRFVWFDELCTFDIARAPSLHTLWQWVLKFDNNPPTVYLLSRVSMRIFGPTPLGLRLPSMLEFYFGSVAMLVYLRRKVGNAVAAFGVVIWWSSSSFYYANEARVYALVFLSFACLLLAWDTATKRADRTVALWCVAIATAVLLASHVFASLCLLAFLVAEFVRYLRRRRPDYPLYAALVLPMAIMISYIPLISVYHGLILWPQFHASPLMAGKFYYRTVDCVARALFVVALTGMLLQQKLRGEEAIEAEVALEDRALIVCMLLNPLLLNLLLMHRKGDFFDRYTLATNAVIYGLIAVVFAVRLRFTKLTSYVATILMLMLMAHMVHREWVKRPRQADPRIMSSLRPDLPLVVSNGATWVEMNQHEPAGVVARLYYIKNRTAAIKYDGTNYYYDFEALDDMKLAGFPFKGNVEPYSAFIASHKQFLIFADPFEWLPLKLQEDGAKFVLVLGYSGVRPNNNGAVALALDPTSEGEDDVPRITFPTVYIAASSPYIAKHVYLVTMP